MSIQWNPSVLVRATVREYHRFGGGGGCFKKYLFYAELEAASAPT